MSRNLSLNQSQLEDESPLRGRWDWRLMAAMAVGAAALVAAEEARADSAGSGSAKAPNVNWDAVRKDIADLLDDDNHDDGSRGPLLVLLAWHAAGTYDKQTKTGGSNGATMRFATEAKDGANAGLHIARDLLAPVKAKYPSVSYADLWTLAGCVAIEEMGGPRIEWRAGRADATSEIACPPNGRLPDAAKGADHLRAIFGRMGFNDQEIVALTGAHTLGRCHTDRSGYTGPWTRAPTTFSNEFFKMLVEVKWTPKKWNGPAQFEDPTGELMMLPADLSLLSDANFKKHVDAYAKDQALFFRDFASAFKKLMELGVPFPTSSSTPPPPAKPAPPAAVAAPRPAATPAAPSSAPAPAAATKPAEKSWWQRFFG